MVSVALSLILLDVTADPAEERLCEELLLTGVDVRQAPAPPGFAEWALPAQLDAVRPDLAPTAWLVADGDQLHLSVAFVEEARAVVRVVDAVRGDEARLALTARELVANATSSVPAPIPAPPVAPPVVPEPEDDGIGWQVGVLGLVPVGTALRPRGGVEVAVGHAYGLAAGAQVGAEQARGTAAAFVRWRLLRAAVGADVVRLPWVTWVEPRAELGVTLDLPEGWFAEPRVRGTFVRDRVERGDAVLYDSGWVEGEIVFGWRQIPGPR